MGRLGSLLDLSDAVLEVSWALLGLSWAVLGASEALLGPSWAVLGRKMAPTGARRSAGAAAYPPHPPCYFSRLTDRDASALSVIQRRAGIFDLPNNICCWILEDVLSLADALQRAVLDAQKMARILKLVPFMKRLSLIARRRYFCGILGHGRTVLRCLGAVLKQHWNVLRGDGDENRQRKP